MQYCRLNTSQANGPLFKLCRLILLVQYRSMSRPIASRRVCRTLGLRRHTEPSLVMFTTALEEAKQLDQEFKATGQLRGPLHGVPVSFKDQFEIAGKDASIGFSRSVASHSRQVAVLTLLISSWCHSPCKDDAALVKLVRQAGGIPVCKGNVPQTMLICQYRYLMAGSSPPNQH